MAVNRRDFLRKSLLGALGGVSVYSAFGNLSLISAAAARSSYAFSDYKALVCVFLNGGNDSFNTIVPYDSSHYATYQNSRHGLALPQSAIAANALNPIAASGSLPGGLPSDGGSYGLHPAMPEMRALFNSGRAAVIANVGTLLHPTTRTEYQNGTIALPPQLFSHSDQGSQWQTSRPDDANANGWGGRMADLLYAGNANQQLPMSISLSGTNLFQRGNLINQYSMSPSGVSPMNYSGNGGDSWIIGPNPHGPAAYDALMSGQQHRHVMERAFAAATSSAIDNSAAVKAALDGAPALVTEFPGDNPLAAQLRMVARLMQVRGALGMQRQVFFVSVGNYDTHSYQLENQDSNLSLLSQALGAFHAATEELGIADGVTSFTASDFGRALSVNSGGTDHGWGGHHFVVGGAVRGQRFYGAMPSLLQNANPDDTGHGQIIPTTAVDQYAATLANWLGVSPSDLGDIFPSLSRFDSSNLGFLG